MGDLQSYDLEALKNVDINAVDPNTLVDIQDVKVNPDLPKQDRLLNFIDQIKNPYCYKCGKIIVKISFADQSATFEDRMESYLMML